MESLLISRSESSVGIRGEEDEPPGSLVRSRVSPAAVTRLSAGLDESFL